MAITTFDGFIAATKQYVSVAKTASRTSIAAAWFSVFDLAGNPGAGTLAGTSTTAGVVPTAATAGTPAINAFGGGATGYLAQVDFGSSVASRLKLFDMVFKAGAYTFNANVTLSAQPSYSAVAICVGGQLRFYRGTNPSDRGILFCESETPRATETPRPMYTAQPLIGGTIPQVTETLVATVPGKIHHLYAPFVANGEINE